jgi:hypothetical protein
LSGSRAIVLSLSVRDADVVRQQLLQMGEQGERALQRLDAAAQRSASGGGVGALSRSTREAGENAGRFGQAAGAAGYQIQDFAVQVQMGQNAITAFGAQASQFLGIFGTGGAIAGAVLTVGLLAYQLLSAGNATDELAEAQKRLEDATKAANDVFETEIERIARLDRTARAAVVSTSALAAASIRQQQAARAERLAELEPTVQQARDAQALAGPETRIPDSVQRRVVEFNRLREEMTRAAAELERLEQRMLGAFSDPSARQGEQAEALRRQLDDRYRIAQQYDERIRELRGLAAIGLFGAAELERLEGQAATDRDAQLSRLEPRPGRAERVAMGAEDVQGILAARTADLTRQFDAYNQAVNLSTAGLEAATPVLTEYARQQEFLTSLLAAGIITEEQFSAEVERTSIRLGEQIEETQRRTERTSQFANELGFSFSSAFEDAIVRGREFSEVLKGLEQDIARIIIRAAITQPLGNALAGGVQSAMGSLGGLFAGAGGAGAGATLPTVSASGGTFANGGIMTAGGPMPLNRYAMGGIANSPQIALFGEGRTPEAYVPLPDGRRIPVAMEGGGGMTFAPTYNIDARGADASMVPRLRAEMVAIARASNAELLDSIQRGGSAARIVGRRA